MLNLVLLAVLILLVAALIVGVIAYLATMWQD